jgi:predicted deacetylase
VLGAAAHGTAVIVSLHDVAPASARATKRWVQLLEPLQVPLTFLLIPGPWHGSGFNDVGDDGEDLAAWLRARQDLGDEMSLHGWCHRADVPGPPARRLVGTIVARGAAELWALDRVQARHRTQRGLAVLAGQDLRIEGTTPPGWLAGRPAIAGLADAGLGYTTDHAGLMDFTSRRRLFAPALCHRPAPPTAGRPSFGEAAGRRVLAGAWRWPAAGRSIRIGLHPADLERPGLGETAVRAVARCLEAGAEPITYREAARRLRAGTWARTGGTS